jgi:exopolyphosphatase/guanosine-5'-triphosphate,3'-diphosphate pyrophosphatase
MRSERYAAIDIGTNAVRLLIGRVHLKGAPRVEKELLVRIPLRLGNDVFSHKELTPESVRQLLETMAAFQHLISVFRPKAVRACATSAMRDSGNGAKVVAEINEKTGLQLEVIDGKQEADLIFSNRIDRQFTNRSNFLYIDVGGGSTEVNLFTGSRRFAYGSFNIGGVRILNGAVPPGEQQRMQQWVAENAGQSDLVAIGSGGNIGRLHRLAKLEEDVPLSRKKLSQLLTQLSSLTIEERIRTFKLKPDRADVVVPAGNIYLQIMKWAGIRAIHVPKFGLADGLILQLCRQHERI